MILRGYGLIELANLFLQRDTRHLFSGVSDLNLISLMPIIYTDDLIVYYRELN